MVASLLGLLLAANLIYVGWHTVSRGTVPIAPRPLLRWQDVLKARAALASVSTTATLVCLVAVFAACTALGIHVEISYSKRLDGLFAAFHSSTLDPNPLVFAKEMDHLVNVKWIIWALHFPASMSVAILIGLALGLIRRRPVANVTASIGVLFLGSTATLGIWMWLANVWWISGLILLWYPSYYGSYLVVLPAAAIVLSVSRAALVRNRDFDLPQLPREHWSFKFLRTTLIVGLPVGLVFGIILAILLHDSTWTIGGIEVICAALFGASLVYADRSAGGWRNIPVSNSRKIVGAM